MGDPREDERRKKFRKFDEKQQEQEPGSDQRFEISRSASKISSDKTLRYGGHESPCICNNRKDSSDAPLSLSHISMALEQFAPFDIIHGFFVVFDCSFCVFLRGIQISYREQMSRETII